MSEMSSKNRGVNPWIVFGHLAMELDVTALCGFMNDINNLSFLNAGVQFCPVIPEGIHWAEGSVSMQGCKKERFYWPSCLDNLPEQIV